MAQIEDENILPLTQAYSNELEQSYSFQYTVAGFKPRALPFNWQRVTLNGAQLNSLSTGYIPYSALGAIYSIATIDAQNNNTRFSFNDPVSVAGTLRKIEISPHTERTGGYATLASSSRIYTYRVAGGYTLNDSERSGYSAIINASKRFGNSMYIDGVWADNWDFAISGSKVLGKGGKGGILTLTAMVNPTKRARPRASTLEAYELTSNNLYNPAWGWIDGRQTSMNISNSVEPIVVLNHTIDFQNELRLNSVIGTRFGESYYTALNWQGELNPFPDYYKYMPSYQNDTDLQLALKEEWEDTSSGVQHIDFYSMVNQNDSGNGRAKYIVERRVTRPLYLTTSTQLQGDNFSVQFQGTYQSDLKFKEVEALLGADYWLDIDSFIEQDEDYKELTQNNLQNPNREVITGDSFGYNYRLNNLMFSVDGGYKLQLGRFEISATSRVSLLTTQRTGYYEKENFAGALSYGKSSLVVGTNAELRVQGMYRIGSRLFINLSGGIGTITPYSTQIFLNQEYRNAINPHLRNSTVAYGEAMVNYTSEKFELHLSLYHYTHTGNTEIRSLYDDLEYTYTQYIINSINTSRTGIEGFLSYNITDNWKLSTTFSIQNNIYTNNPTASIYKDNNGEELVANQKIMYQGKHLGGSPQQIGALSIGYNSWGWMVRASIVGFGGSYVILSPVRYSERALHHSNEVTSVEDLLYQEKYSANYSIDLFGGYTHRFQNNTSLGLYLSVNNITNNKNIVNYGYQSDRFFKDGWTITPQASKYYYSLPFNFSLNCTFRF